VSKRKGEKLTEEAQTGKGATRKMIVKKKDMEGLPSVEEGERTLPECQMALWGTLGRPLRTPQRKSSKRRPFSRTNVTDRLTAGLSGLCLFAYAE